MTNIKLFSLGVIILIILIVGIANFPFVWVAAGHRAVVYNTMTGSKRVIDEGTAFRAPFVETVSDINVQTQKTDLPAAEAGTFDSQIVTVDVTVNWHIDPGHVADVYDQIGSNLDTIQSTVFLNTTQDAIKASTSKYKALDIQKNRDKVAAGTLTLLQKKVAKYHIIVDGLSITNIAFSSQFRAAIESAAEATQHATQATNEEQVAIANKVITQTNADAQAYQQKVVQQTLTPELLQKMWIEKWDGKLPTYNFGGGSNGSGAVPFFNLPTGQ